MKHFALLTIFLATTLMAQAPSQMEIPNIFAYRYGLKQLEIDGLREQLAGMQQQINMLSAAKSQPTAPANDCAKQLLAKGHDLAAAVLLFRKNPATAKTGETPGHPMYQAAAEFIQKEPGCAL